MIIRLISLLVRGIISATTETAPVMRYEEGIKGYSKEYFDSDFYFLFFKFPMGDMPGDIAYYNSQIGNITLAKKNDTKHFEIYETNVLSDKELAMNVRMAYADFVMTGINSRKNSVVNRNEFFVLFINDKLNRLEVRSSLQNDITDKMIKSDFGEYIIHYLRQKRELASSETAVV